MKNVIIWGVGQGGRMVANLLHGDITVRAFCDSDASKWGASLDGVPVVPPEAIPDMAPDAAFKSGPAVFAEAADRRFGTARYAPPFPDAH